MARRGSRVPPPVPPQAWPQYFAGCAAAFGGFSLGSCVGWSAPAERPIVTDSVYGFTVTRDDFGWISSALSLGCALVAIPTGLLVLKFGRKPIMLLVIPPYLCAWALIIYAPCVYMLILGRFMLGLFGGTFAITAPMYTTEIALLAVRGRLGSLFNMLFVSGILFAFIIGAVCSIQCVNYLCALLPILFFVVFFFMPESPVYHMQNGNRSEAERSMRWLRGEKYDPRLELAQIRATVPQQQIGVCDALRRKATLKGLFIGVMLMFLQQFTGCAAIVAYSTSIFEEAGTGFSADISTILVGTFFVVAAGVSLMVMDLAGRRILLILSSFFVILTTAVMGLYLYLMRRDETSMQSFDWLPVCTVCCFIAFYAIGMGPVPFVMMVELFAEDVKALGTGITGTSGSLFSFLATKSFPMMVGRIGTAASFWMFTAIAILALLFNYFLVPETKGKTLAQIQVILGGKKVKFGKKDEDRPSAI